MLGWMMIFAFLAVLSGVLTLTADPAAAFEGLRLCISGAAPLPLEVAAPFTPPPTPAPAARRGSGLLATHGLPTTLRPEIFK